jgi:hypothetical protein
VLPRLSVVWPAAFKEVAFKVLQPLWQDNLDFLIYPYTILLTTGLAHLRRHYVDYQLV